MVASKLETNEPIQGFRLAKHLVWQHSERFYEKMYWQFWF